LHIAALVNGRTSDRLVNSASLRAADPALSPASCAETFAVLRKQDKRRGCQLGFVTRGRSGSPSCILRRDLRRSAPTGQASRPGSARRQQRHRHGDLPRVFPATRMRKCRHCTQAQVAEVWVGTRACTWVGVGARDGRDPGACGGERRRDPRLAPWWTWRSVRRRLPANLTEQAGSA
jgi:hypothetical protein